MGLKMKKSYDYTIGFSEEKPCMGGIGSKPAFELLVSTHPDVIVKRAYTIYQGHVGFSVHAVTRFKMKQALKKLHEEYHWIDGDDAYSLEKETHEVDI